MGRLKAERPSPVDLQEGTHDSGEVLDDRKPNVEAEGLRSDVDSPRLPELSLAETPAEGNAPGIN